MERRSRKHFALVFHVYWASVILQGNVTLQTLTNIWPLFPAKITINFARTRWYSFLFSDIKMTYLSKRAKRYRETELQMELTHLSNILSILQIPSEVPIEQKKILNFDEINLSNDSESQKRVFRRGYKYPKELKNSSNGCISLIIIVSTSGRL